MDKAGRLHNRCIPLSKANHTAANELKPPDCCRGDEENPRNESTTCDPGHSALPSPAQRGTNCAVIAAQGRDRAEPGCYPSKRSSRRKKTKSEELDELGVADEL